MRLHLHIQTLMLVIALFGVALALIILFPPLGSLMVLVAPLAVGFILMPARWRPRVAVWLCALAPLILFLSLYTTWFTAWSILGHRPRISLDDPTRIHPVVSLLGDMQHWLLLAAITSPLLGLLFGLFTVTVTDSLEPRRWWKWLFGPATVWLASLALPALLRRVSPGNSLDLILAWLAD